MRATDFIHSKYLSTSDFDDKPSNWTITAVGSDIIGRDDPQEKAVLQLADSKGKPAGRGLVLNVTNLRSLALAFGDNMDEWVGKPIQIDLIPVNFRGEQKQGLRVRPRVTAVRGAGRASRNLKDDLDDEISV